MIQSFGDRETEELFATGNSSRFTAIARVAVRKLIQLNQARSRRFGGSTGQPTGIAPRKLRRVLFS